jgi:predicted DNA-binding transcriptional regulator AlpA
MLTKHSQNILTELEAAEYARVSVSFLRASRLTPPRTDGPPYVRLGRRAVRYLVADLDAWIDARRQIKIPA